MTCTMHPGPGTERSLQVVQVAGESVSEGRRGPSLSQVEAFRSVHYLFVSSEKLHFIVKKHDLFRMNNTLI